MWLLPLRLRWLIAAGAQFAVVSAQQEAAEINVGGDEEPDESVSSGNGAAIAVAVVTFLVIVSILFDEVCSS